MSSQELDPFEPDQLEAPYELYRRLRESSPVHEIPDMKLFLVTRHADVLDVARRNDDFSSHLTAFVQRGAVSETMLVRRLAHCHLRVEGMA